LVVGRDGGKVKDGSPAGGDASEPAREDFLAMIRAMDSTLDHGGIDGFRASFAAMLASMRCRFKVEEDLLLDSQNPAAAEHAVEHKVLLHMANHVAKMTATTSDLHHLKFSLRSIASLLAEHALRDE
jgi:hypothetical protein